MCRPGLCERAARQRRLPQELPQPARHGAQRRRGRALAQGPAPEGGGEGAQLVALAAAPLLRAGKLCQALGDGPERHRPRFPRKRDAQPPGQRPQRRRWRSVSGLGPQQRRQRALRPTGGVLGRAAGEQGGDARGDLALASTNRIPLRHTDDLQERLRPSHGPRTTHPPGQGTVHAEGERVQVGALRHRPLEQFGSAPGRASRAKDGQYIHIECGRLPCPRASTLLNCPQQVAEQHLPRWHEFILLHGPLRPIHAEARQRTCHEDTRRGSVLQCPCEVGVAHTLLQRHRSPALQRQLQGLGGQLANPREDPLGFELGSSHAALHGLENGH
mmetsp:Transcript_5214/g.19588  ORF Transcript_5214/g.19588 Transcript_5214/m.19588 type:complete len:330 (+) Transcript_5214:1021-2010(+)